MVGEENLSEKDARLNQRMMTRLSATDQKWWRETQPPLIKVLPYGSTVKEIKGTIEQRRYGEAKSNFGKQGLASLGVKEVTPMPTPQVFPGLPAGISALIAGSMRGTPGGMIASAAMTAPKTSIGQKVTQFAQQHPIITGLGAAGVVAGVGALGVAIGRSSSSSSGTARRRRTNPNNPRALRRALSRITSYSKLNRKVEKDIKKAARLVD